MSTWNTSLLYQNFLRRYNDTWSSTKISKGGWQNR
jgi:hypothetical protein